MADTLSLTAEEQSQLDQMRADDAQTGSPAPPTSGATTESPEPDQQQPAQPPRTVPLAALHEERERRKESDRRLAEEQQRIRTLEERTNLLLQRFGQPQEQQRPAEPPKPAIPDLAVDPVGHIISTQQELSRQLQANQQNWQQQQQQLTQFQQAQLAIGNLVSRSQGLERQFAAEHPDYQSAVAHLRDMRSRELEIAGIRDPGRRMQIMEEEGLGIQVAAFQNGANPAEMLYELAKLRGYAESKPAADASAAGIAQPQPTQSTAAQERIQNIQQGQQQARSLSGARGSGPQALTAQRLLEMNETEFAKMLETSEGMELLGA